MITQKFDNRESWLEARKGKITGSTLKDFIVYRGTNEKIGFWRLLAHKVAMPDDGEDQMSRGSRLEPEAIAHFVKKTKIKVERDLELWIREDNESMAVSPDASDKKKTIAVEAKCLESAKHLEAWFTQKIPSDFEEQIYQYFIVNDKLKTVYLAFYDPRVPSKDFFVLKIDRKEISKQIENIRVQEIEKLKKIEELASTLIKF